jgi:pimeloyl-ACP methyl ester carboxylesterase
MVRSQCAGHGDVRAIPLSAPALVASGYRVVLMDLRGLGDSTAGESI